MYADRRTVFQPETEIAVFVFDRWRESKLPLQPFAEGWDSDPATAKSLMTNHLPRQVTLDKLIARYGDAVPAVPTENERARKHTIDVMRPKRTQPGDPEWPAVRKRASRKRSEKLRGKAKSEEHRRALSESMKASPRLADNLGRISRTPRNKLLHLVGMAIHHHGRAWARKHVTELLTRASELLGAHLPVDAGNTIRHRLGLPPLARAGRTWKVSNSKRQMIRDLSDQGFTRGAIIDIGRDLQFTDEMGGWTQQYIDDTFFVTRRSATY
jgi:hypothetical protein